MTDLSRAFAAAKSGDIDTLKDMIRTHGPEFVNDLRQPQFLSETLLLEAISSKQMETVRFLLDQGADINDNSHFSPIRTAVTISASTPEIAALLIERGADVRRYESESRTSLFTPFLFGMFLHDAEKGEKLMRLLLDAGALPDGPPDIKDTPPLHLAIDHDSAQAVRLLTAAGADVEKTNIVGQTPLTSALVKNIRPDVILALIDAGADPFMKDRHGLCPYDRLLLKWRDNKRDPEIESLMQRFEAIGSARHKKFVRQIIDFKI